MLTKPNQAFVADEAPSPRRLPSLAAVKTALLASIAGLVVEDFPFRHFVLRDLLPAPVLSALTILPFRPLRLDGVSGRRELHNDQRLYFDAACQAQHPACRLAARAFQTAPVVRALAAATGAQLAATNLRIEYALDAEGFWLEPHTDLGVKSLTIFAPLPDGPGQSGLGTDLYQSRSQWARRLPFSRGLGVAFVPGDDTWHGFEPRPITAVRRSLIVNYVTAEWRARDQLSFPDSPVRA